MTVFVIQAAKMNKDLGIIIFIYSKIENSFEFGCLLRLFLSTEVDFDQSYVRPFR